MASTDSHVRCLVSRKIEVAEVYVAYFATTVVIMDERASEVGRRCTRSLWDDLSRRRSSPATHAVRRQAVKHASLAITTVQQWC